MVGKQDNDFCDTTASRLRALRQEAGLTIDEVARLLGTGGSVVSMYETGRRKPSLGVLRRIALLYNKSADYILCLSDSPAPQSAPVHPVPPESVWTGRVSRLLSQLDEDDRRRAFNILHAAFPDIRI